MLRKSLTMLVVLSMVMALFVPVVNVSAEASGDTVWYSNTFDNGGSDLVNVSNDYLNLSVKSYLTHTTEFDGNKGFGPTKGDWYEGSDNAISFDFTKGGAIEPKTSGVYKVSFDFTVDSNTGANGSNLGLNMNDTSSGGIMMYLWDIGEKVICGIGNEVSTYPGKADGRRTLENNKLYNMDIIINMTEKQILYYLNGERLRTEDGIAYQEIPDAYAVLKNFNFNPTGFFTYLDNLEVSELSSEAPVGLKEATMSEKDGYVDIKTTKTLRPVFDEDERGTVDLDGNDFTDYEWLDTNTVRFYFNKPLSVGEHYINVYSLSDFFSNYADPEEKFVLNVTEYVRPSYEMLSNILPWGHDSLEEKTVPYLKDGYEGARYRKYAGNGVDAYYVNSRFGTSSVNGTAGLCVPRWLEIREFQDLMIDFTNEGTTGGIALNSGKIIDVSFDFAINSDACSFARLVLNRNMNDYVEGCGMDFQVRDGKARYGFNGYYGVSSFAENTAYTTALNNNEIHRMSIYLDMRDASELCIYYYLDGNRLNSANAPGSVMDRQIVGNTTLRNLSFYLSDILTYFNNLTVSSIESNSFMALDCDDVYANNTAITVNFSEMPASTNTTEGITVTKNDGTKVNVTNVEVLDNNKVKLTLAEPIKKSTRYTVKFGKEFKNVFGYAISNEENVIKFKPVEIASYKIEENSLKVTIDNTTDRALSPKVIVSNIFLKQLTNIKIFSCTEVQPGDVQEFTFDITGISENPNVYVWEDFNSCQPLLTLN